MQSTLARQLCWLPIHDVIQPNFPKILMQTKEAGRGFYADSEELTKLVVLSIARAYVITS